MAVPVSQKQRGRISGVSEFSLIFASDKSNAMGRGLAFCASWPLPQEIKIHNRANHWNRWRNGFGKNHRGPQNR